MAIEAQVIQLLTEIVRWQRFQNRQALRTRLEEILSTDADRLIYDLTDGKKSQPQIAKRAGVSQPTVSNKWKAWRTLGIIYELPDEPGRCCHLATLESVGLSRRARSGGSQ